MAATSRRPARPTCPLRGVVNEAGSESGGAIPCFRTATAKPRKRADLGASPCQLTPTMRFGFCHIVGRRGLEPRTYGLKVHSSAIELAARGDRVPVGCEDGCRV